MGAEIAAAVQGSMLPCTAMVITTLCRHTQSSGHSPSTHSERGPPFNAHGEQRLREPPEKNSWLPTCILCSRPDGVKTLQQRYGARRLCRRKRQVIASHWTGDQRRTRPSLAKCAEARVIQIRAEALVELATQERKCSLDAL